MKTRRGLAVSLPIQLSNDESPQGPRQFLLTNERTPRETTVHNSSLKLFFARGLGYNLCVCNTHTYTERQMQRSLVSPSSGTVSRERGSGKKKRYPCDLDERSGLIRREALERKSLHGVLPRSRFFRRSPARVKVKIVAPGGFPVRLRDKRDCVLLPLPFHELVTSNSSNRPGYFT